MPESERRFTDAELDAAVEALSEPERFRIAEARVARMAPRLQSILGQALNEGGWLGSAQQHELRQALKHEDPHERAEAVESLLAEEARIGMFVGVAVGWELARELES